MRRSVDEERLKILERAREGLDAEDYERDQIKVLPDGTAETAEARNEKERRPYTGIPGR